MKAPTGCRFARDALFRVHRSKKVFLFLEFSTTKSDFKFAFFYTFILLLFQDIFLIIKAKISMEYEDQPNQNDNGLRTCFRFTIWLNSIYYCKEQSTSFIDFEMSAFSIYLRPSVGESLVQKFTSERSNSTLIFKWLIFGNLKPLFICNGFGFLSIADKNKHIATRKIRRFLPC
jgi:hypothetical protein